VSEEAVAAAKAYKTAENLKKKSTSMSAMSVMHSTTTKQPASPVPGSMMRAPKRQATLSVVMQQYANFSKEEIAEIQNQALRAIISANLPYGVFDDLEMIKLMEMLQACTMDVLPSRKVVGGQLLNDAVEKIDDEMKGLFDGKNIGLSYIPPFLHKCHTDFINIDRSDGWKSLAWR
jgi:hypothetical protein